MKRLLIAVCIIAAFASCKKTSSTPTQTNAQITSADVSLTFGAGLSNTNDTVLNIASSGISAPAQGTGQTWNFASASVVPNQTVTYASVGSPYPSGAFGFNLSVPTIVPGEPETQMNVFNVTDSGLCNLGQNLSQEVLTIPGLGTITYAQQTCAYSKGLPETPMLPFGYGDSTSYSNITVAENFVANAPAYGLTNTPGQQQFVNSGSATCWATGKLTLPGATSAIQVLVVKVQIWTVTNYFLGGQPAPAQLLGLLGLTNGATTFQGWYDFYSPGKGLVGEILVDANNSVTTASFAKQ